MREIGIDYFTTGNHIWSKKEFLPHLDNPQVRVLRPANYEEPEPGRGMVIFEHKGAKIQLINLIGRAFMRGPIVDYFDLVEKYLNQNEYKEALELADKIGAMLWGIIKNEK